MTKFEPQSAMDSPEIEALQTIRSPAETLRTRKHPAFGYCLEFDLDVPSPKLEDIIREKKGCRPARFVRQRLPDYSARARKKIDNSREEVMFRRTLLGGVAVSALAAPAVLRAQEPLKMRLSLDTSATHTRTMQMTTFAQELDKVASGKLKVEVFHSAQLFRDRDVGKALRQGGAEMGVPGPWNLTGIEANLDITQSPAFYGRLATEVYKVIDGDVGRALNGMLEKKLGVHILGKWLDLGASHTFSTAKPLNAPEDLKGLKIRTSGGAGQMVRVKFFEGVPNFTAWPDVPLALSQGTFDALFTTNESVKSAKLWDSGVKFGLQDHQFFAQYIPMVSESFWKKLGPDLQKIVSDLWASHIDLWRKDMADSQAESLETMKKAGVKVVSPGAASLEAVRNKLMATQEAVIKELKLDPALVAQANAALGMAGKS